MSLELYKSDRKPSLLYDPFSFFDDMFYSPFGRRTAVSEFRADITDEGDVYKLTCDLPGFRREDISLTVEDGILILTAARHSEVEEGEEASKYLRKERSFGTFKRRFDLSGIQPEAIRAVYVDGVLTLSMPKDTDPPPRTHRIPIE